MPDHDHNHQHASHHHHHSVDHHLLLLLDAEIAQARSFIENKPHSSWETATLLKELGSLLRQRFSESKESRYINEAVEVHRNSLKIFQDHPHHESRPSLLSHYGFVLHDRYHHTHEVNDIIAAVSQHETALGLLKQGDGNEFDVLINLAKTLRCRFDAGGEKAHLDRAISLSRRAVGLEPSRHPPLGILVDYLERRAKLAHHEDDNAQMETAVNELIEVREKELRLASLFKLKSEPGKLENDIATSFFHLFSTTRLVQLLDTAISIFREARTFPCLSPRYEVNILINLSACLRARYNKLKDSADLEEAVELSRLCYEKPGPLFRAFIITTLCNLLRTQYKESGGHIEAQ